MALICKITGNTRAAVARQTVLVSLWQRSSLNIFGNRGQDEGSSRAAVRIREFSCWPCRGALLRISEFLRSSAFGFRNWAADKPANENSCMGWRTPSCQGSQLDGTVVV